MNREKFEYYTDISMIAFLSFALGAVAYMGFTDSRENDTRASEVSLLREQIIDLRDDIRDVCNSLPGTVTYNNTPDKVISKADAIIPETTPPTTVVENSQSGLSVSTTSPERPPESTTTTTQAGPQYSPCP